MKDDVGSIFDSAKKNIFDRQKELKVLRNEINYLKQLKSQSGFPIVFCDGSGEESKSMIFTTSVRFEDDVAKYIDRILGFNNDEFLSSNISSLFSNDYYHDYDKLLVRIVLEIKKRLDEALEYRDEVIASEEPDEEIGVLDDIISDLTVRMELVKDMHDFGISTGNVDKEGCHFIFVTDSSGNAKAVEALKKIDERHYDSFLKLFDSIKKGTFKGLKYFNDNGRLYGIYEVRDNADEERTRVLFKRVSENYFVIIGAFVKRCDIGVGYISHISAMVTDYRNSLSNIRNHLSDPEFLSENLSSEIELYSLLSSTKKAKPAEKVIKND